MDRQIHTGTYMDSHMDTYTQDTHTGTHIQLLTVVTFGERGVTRELTSYVFFKQ